MFHYFYKNLCNNIYFWYLQISKLPLFISYVHINVSVVYDLQPNIWNKITTIIENMLYSATITIIQNNSQNISIIRISKCQEKESMYLHIYYKKIHEELFKEYDVLICLILIINFSKSTLTSMLTLLVPIDSCVITYRTASYFCRFIS